MRAAVANSAPRTSAAMTCVAADVPKPNGRSRLYSLLEFVEMGIQSVTCSNSPSKPRTLEERYLFSRPLPAQFFHLACSERNLRVHKAEEKPPRLAVLAGP